MYIAVTYMTVNQCFIIGWDIFMRFNQYKANVHIAIAFITVLTVICMLSTAVFATGGMVSKPRTNNISSNTAEDDESEILSSQDWDALLNVSSEENSHTINETTEGTPVLNSPLANGIGQHSIFIWGCIAVGLGILGIAFFIYSQFIYKHIKRPAESHDASLHDTDYTKEVTLRRGDSFKEQITKIESRQEQQGKATAKSTQMPSKETADAKQDMESLLKYGDKAETEEVDWDQFFDDYKNQQQKDK